MNKVKDEDTFKLVDEESGVPFIHNTEELQLWLRPLYIISDYLVNEETYNEFMKEIMNVIKGSFTIRECREYPIKFKFNEKEKSTHTLQLRHFAINMMLWMPFIELNDLDVLNKDFILDCNKDIPNINDYINYKVIATLREYHVKPISINKLLSESLYNLSCISIDFALILGLNFSAKTIIDMYDKYPEIKDMMEVTFAPDMQPYEIENLLNEYESREVEIYESEPNNPIGVILRVGTGIKRKQLREFTISESLKPTLEGVTVPKPIEGSTMLKGLASPSDLYLDASGARKSLNRPIYLFIMGDYKLL